MKKRNPKRGLKRERRQRERPAPVAASFVKADIHREVRYITQLAQAEDARVVRVGNLVLFSTRTRDAWLLDVEDSFAICLCRDGEPQPFRIVDSPDTFAIEWTARFTMDAAAFVVQERSGRIVTIHGYPVVEIAAACR
jgi:hypothetical protein